MTGFMMQRGRQIICGDVGPGLGDSMYDGTIYVAGKVKSLGHRLRRGRVDRRRHRADRAQVPDLRPRRRRPRSQKFVCGKKLYNYDTLEPCERKLVL